MLHHMPGIDLIMTKAQAMRFKNIMKAIASYEISYALVLKFALLTLLWFFFVRGREIVPTAPAVFQHLFN